MKGAFVLAGLIFALHIYAVFFLHDAENVFVRYWVESLALISFLVILGFAKDFKNWKSLEKGKKSIVISCMLFPVLIVLAGLADFLLLLLGND